MTVSNLRNDKTSGFMYIIVLSTIKIKAIFVYLYLDYLIHNNVRNKANLAK